MRSVLIALVLATTTLSAGLATAKNPDKIIRSESAGVTKVPTISVKTAQLAEQYEQAKNDTSKPIPSKVRKAKQEVLLRNQEIAKALETFRAESVAIEGAADALAHPKKKKDATPEALSQAAETYVTAAQVLVKKSGKLSERVARENPDQAAKTDSAREMAVDYKKAAGLYRMSADTEDRRADTLAGQGKTPEAQVARDKGQFTRVYASKLDMQASEIEAKGVPGADAFTMTSGDTKVSSN